MRTGGLNLNNGERKDMQPSPPNPLRSQGDRCCRRLPPLAVALLLACLLHPLSATAQQPLPPTTGPTPQAIAEADGFAGSISLMAQELASHLAEPDPEAGELAQGLAVCSFVDLKKLYRTSSFGRYLAEQLMSEFQQRGFKVMELRKTTSLMIQEKRGEYTLSRDPAELNLSVKASATLTGTYTEAGDHVLVNAKIIDNRNSAMLASATLVFPRNRMVAQLLADRASATTDEREVVYMKRLEL